MRFKDFTVMNGLVTTRRSQDTEHLVPEAVPYCRELIRELRRHPPNTLVSAGIDDPPFWVSMGLPDGFDINIDASKFFCVWASQNIFPFQINLVLKDGEWDHNDYLSCGTLSILSGIASQVQPALVVTEELAEEIKNSRPVMATTVCPIDPAAGREVVMVAADFCTCFAAALLTEEK